MSDEVKAEKPIKKRTKEPSEKSAAKKAKGEGKPKPKAKGKAKEKKEKKEPKIDSGTMAKKIADAVIKHMVKNDMTNLTEPDEGEDAKKELRVIIQPFLLELSNAVRAEKAKGEDKPKE